jgi:hypothetical protein
MLLPRYYEGLTEEGPEEAPVPHARLQELTAFQRLLVVRCMQPKAFLEASKVWFGST